MAYVIRGEVVERREIQIGGTDGDRVEVRRGLAPGDRVVLTPSETLRDGAKVVVK